MIKLRALPKRKGVQLKEDISKKPAVEAKTVPATPAKPSGVRKPKVSNA